MNEFSNRISAQRKILHLVNRHAWKREELFSLSEKAIGRWVGANEIDGESRLVELVRLCSEKLFFLANKSQEQITDEYELVASEILKITELLEMELSSIS